MSLSSTAAATLRIPFAPSQGPKPLFQIGISGDVLGQHLDGDGAVEAGVASLVDFAHAARANLGSDVEVAEPRTASKGHALYR